MQKVKDDGYEKAGGEAKQLTWVSKNMLNMCVCEMTRKLSESRKQEFLWIHQGANSSADHISPSLSSQHHNDPLFSQSFGSNGCHDASVMLGSELWWPAEINRGIERERKKWMMAYLRYPFTNLALVKVNSEPSVCGHTNTDRCTLAHSRYIHM